MVFFLDEAGAFKAAKCCRRAMVSCLVGASIEERLKSWIYICKLDTEQNIKS